MIWTLLAVLFVLLPPMRTKELREAKARREELGKLGRLEDLT